jgi:site-specific recombinase XerD
MDAIETSKLILTDPQPLDQNPAAVYIAALGGVKTTGGRTQAQALRVIAQVFGTDPLNLNWGALRYQHTNAIRAQLMERYSPASANKMLSALRQALKHARRLGQISGSDYDNAIDLDPVTGETLPAGRDLSQGEILALMNACMADESAAGTRDAAMIAVMYGAGLRRAEVVSLTLESFNPETGVLKITGKRKKQRTAHITNGALAALTDWLELRGNEPGALFVAINKGGKMDVSKGVYPEAVYYMLTKRAAQANVKNFSPHDMRRTFIGDLLDKGADISTVAKMAGHANVQTTGQYDRRGEATKRQAASLLHVPYKSRSK